MSDKSIRISHPRTIPIKKISGKGNVQFDQGKFHSYIEDLDKNNLSVVQLEFGEETDFNSIRLSVLEKEKDFFPNTFRFEISSDGIVWEPIIQEVDFRKLSRNEGVWHFSLIRSRFLKLVAKPQNKSGSNSYRMAFANLKVMISGVVKISASSENDRLWVKENLIDERPDYGWSSAEKNAPGEEFFIIDLGSVNRVDEVRLLSKNSEDTHFPEHFVIYYSEDDLSWYQLLEEPRFISQPATWYRWRFLPANIRFLKLVAIDNPTSGKKSFITQITEIELFAAPDLIDLSKRERSQPLPYSSVLRSGLVRLAVDGEVKEGVAIQGNDRRLRDATTEFKGIVELASDGEEKEGVVVQGNDKRLKIGTELIHGLARLARSGESKPGLVVQSDDERIRGATVASAGIVELAEDGETRPGVVVQGNDSRLKKATAKGFGLVLHASHGENSAGKVVTADDPRLQDATTEKSGILRFAGNGEEEPLTALQGNDKRLKKATTESHGIVELAQSGENKEGVVVQGNDQRLRPAEFDEAGIVMLSRPGVDSSGKVVTADDPRLSDKREPKEHSHPYSPVNHDFNSHSGLIRLSGSTESEFKNIVAPPQNHSVIFGKNENEKGAGIAGVGGSEGLLGFANKFGVSGYSKGTTDESAGILGVSDNGYGGIFSSQKNYAMTAVGSGIKEKDIVGSGKAILAIGDSLFRGSLRISEANGQDCIARYFALAKGDVISPGDLVVLSGEEGKVAKSKNSYSTKVAGVAVKSASLELGEKKSSDVLLVALSGIVNLNVDASDGEVSPGDLLVAGLSAGYAIKADPAKLKPGMLVGKALGSCKKGKLLIPVLICLQ